MFDDLTWQGRPFQTVQHKKFKTSDQASACAGFQENRTFRKQLFLFALGVNLGLLCDPESTDPCETNAICDDYGICSKCVAVTTFCFAFNIPAESLIM